MTEIPRNHSENDTKPALNRREIAVALRQLEIDVDFEDWDGLDDNDVLGSIATLAVMYDFDVEEVLSQVVPLEEFGEDDNEV